jgi:hypothetical protein
MNEVMRRLRLPMATVPGLAGAVLALLVWSSPVGAQEPYVYPNKGQSKDKVEKDKYACYQWAKKQTGFDPMQAPTATAPPPPQQGGAGRGAARGAAVGAIGGAIGGNAGKGAAIGAATGGVVGGVRRRRSQAEQEQYAQQQAAGYNDRRGEYDRAWGACLEGKGYSVK